MSQQKPIGSIPRRSFLRAAGCAIAAPIILPWSVLGATAPSKRINIGCIGVGRMGTGDLMETIGFDDVSIVAVCDLDSNRLSLAKKRVENFYAGKRPSGEYKGCATYADYRELISRADIDTVQIALPDHWHTMPALAAARAGKDIFIQKPLTLTHAEGRLLSDTVRRYARVLQVGSQQRSDSRFRFGCELVRNGRIGKVHTVKVGLPTDPGGGSVTPMPVPPNLNYEMWLGPAPWAPYTEDRVHPQKDINGRPGWLRITDYCLGMITGWGSHHNDIVQWGLGTELTGPVEVSAEAEFPKDGLWDVHGLFRIEYTYASGTKVICADDKRNKPGILFEGSEGWVWVDRGRIDAQPKSLLTSNIGPDEIHLYRSNSHKGNFIECIKSRRETICPVEVGHRSCTVCILGHIAMVLGRKLRWDPEKEIFTNDVEANRMLSRPYRGPWTV